MLKHPSGGCHLKREKLYVTVLNLYTLASRGLEEPAHASRGLFLINTLLLYPSLSPHRQTDGQTDREQINPVGAGTLASRRLEEPFF